MNVARLTRRCSRPAAGHVGERATRKSAAGLLNGSLVRRNVLSIRALNVGGALVFVFACSPASVRQEPPLYSSSAREQGIESRQRIWEAERYPNVSVLRATPDQDNTALGFGLLMFGYLSELAQLRGFAYYVVLEDAPMFSRPGQGAHWDTVVGLTNSPEPDIAHEFPEYYNPERRYDVKPADLRRLVGAGASGK